MARDTLPGDLAPIQVVLTPGSFVIRLYHIDDAIWKLSPREREYQAVKDIYREMMEWRDTRRSKEGER